MRAWLSHRLEQGIDRRDGPAIASQRDGGKGMVVSRVDDKRAGARRPTGIADPQQSPVAIGCVDHHCAETIEVAGIEHRIQRSGHRLHQRREAERLVVVGPRGGRRLAGQRHEDAAALDRTRPARGGTAAGGRGCDEPLKSFMETGRAYVRFALANPALFRLIFTSSTRSQAAPGEIEALALLDANARAVLPEDATAEVREAKALRAWSLVHGLAMLMLDGRVPAEEALIDAVLRA